VRDARAQHALEVLGIVRVGEFAWARQVHVVQTREPEAQRAQAQQQRPRFALVVGERAHRLVRCQQRRGALRLEFAFGIDAPVVDRYRQVVGERVGRGEAEVDDPRQFVADEQRVVAERVAADRACGNRRRAIFRCTSIRRSQVELRRLRNRFTARRRCQAAPRFACRRGIRWPRAIARIWPIVRNALGTTAAHRPP
jgi:hypothetical protein